MLKLSITQVIYFLFMGFQLVRYKILSLTILLDAPNVPIEKLYT
jgi:hypothetical protein